MAEKVTKQQIIKKLEGVIDPELGMSIVDLGLIYDVRVEKKKAFVKMTFTTPACPMMSYILDDMKKKLDELEGIDIEITVVFEPLWTPDRMSKKAKIKLGML